MVCPNSLWTNLSEVLDNPVSIKAFYFGKAQTYIQNFIKIVAEPVLELYYFRILWGSQ